jgi:hypothetical protein
MAGPTLHRRCYQTVTNEPCSKRFACSLTPKSSTIESLPRAHPCSQAATHLRAIRGCAHLKIEGHR